MGSVSCAFTLTFFPVYDVELETFHARDVPVNVVVPELWVNVPELE